MAVEARSVFIPLPCILSITDLAFVTQHLSGDREVEVPLYVGLFIIMVSGVCILSADTNHYLQPKFLAEMTVVVPQHQWIIEEADETLTVQ